MDLTRRECPICKQVLTAQDGYFSCEQHGDWYSYSANLLVRAPSAEDKAPERVAMPWERQVASAF